jgi:uncharacterized membrane protein
MKVFLILFLAFALYACTSVSIQDVKPKIPNGQASCDTLAEVSFSMHVLPIIAANCNECHAATNPSSGISLSTYNQVSRVSKNGELYGSITSAPGYNPMPANGKSLPPCDIAHIKSWIDAGSLNN